MNRKTFNKLFIFFIYGVPLTFLICFVLNLKTHSNFYKFYSKSAPYTFTVGLINYLNREIVGKRIIGNVHFGKDSYLFYLPKNDGNVWKDIFGGVPVEKHFREDWNKYLNRYSNNYLFILAPNKERILREYLDLYTNPTFAHEGNYESFPQHEKVIFADSFLTKKDYYASDSHWNYLGARKAISEVFKKKGIDPSSLWGLPEIKTMRTGDITHMINHPSFILYPSENLENNLELGLEKVRHSITVPNEIELFENEGSSLDLKILVIGDSFRESLAQVLASKVKSVKSVKFVQTEYLKSLDLNSFDLIIEVRVERYLDRIPN